VFLYIILAREEGAHKLEKASGTDISHSEISVGSHNIIVSSSILNGK